MDGIYNFSFTDVDDTVMLWTGPTAVAGWTGSNQNLTVSMSNNGSVSIYIEEGAYLPFRVAFFQGLGHAEFRLTVYAPDGDVIVDPDSASPYVVQHSCDLVAAPPYLEPIGYEENLCGNQGLEFAQYQGNEDYDPILIKAGGTYNNTVLATGNTSTVGGPNGFYYTYGGQSLQIYYMALEYRTWPGTHSTFILLTTNRRLLLRIRRRSLYDFPCRICRRLRRGLDWRSSHNWLDGS